MIAAFAEIYLPKPKAWCSKQTLASVEEFRMSTGRFEDMYLWFCGCMSAVLLLRKQIRWMCAGCPIEHGVWNQRQHSQTQWHLLQNQWGQWQKDGERACRCQVLKVLPFHSTKQALTWMHVGSRMDAAAADIRLDQPIREGRWACKSSTFPYVWTTGRRAFCNVPPIPKWGGGGQDRP